MTGRLTSELIEPYLRETFGDVWVQWADDLDGAIAEFGQFVDGKMESMQHEYMRRAHERKEPIDHDRLREAGDEAFQYWVMGRVRRYRNDTSGKYEKLIEQKPAAYDLRIDADWSGDDVEVIPVGRRSGKPITSERLGV